MDIVQGVRIEVQTKGTDKVGTLSRSVETLIEKVGGLNNLSLAGLTSNLNSAAQAAANLVKSISGTAVTQQTAQMGRSVTAAAETSSRAVDRAAAQQERAAKRAADTQAREAKRAADAAEREQKRATDAAEREQKRLTDAAEREHRRMTAAVEREARKRQAAIEREARAEEREMMNLATRAARGVQRNFALGKLTDGQTSTLGSLGLSASSLAGMATKDAAKAINEALGNIPDKAERTRMAFQLMGQAAQSATPQINSLSGGLIVLLQSFMKGGTSGMSAALGALINPLTIILALVFAVTAAFRILVNVISMVASAMYEAGKTGLEYNAFLLEAKLGIGSLLMTYGRWIDGQGRVIDSSRAFVRAQQLSVQVLEQARIAALETTATFPEMVRGLQEGMGPALQAGFNPTQVVRFTQAMTQAAGAIGMPFEQLGQEIRGVFEFDFSKNSRISRMLFQGMGKSAEELRTQFAAMSSAARFDFIMDRLKAFSLAGDQLARTPKGALSNLKDAYQQILGAGTVKLTDDFTKAVLRLSNSFLIVGKNGEKAFNPFLIEAIKKTYDSVDRLGMRVLDLAEAFSALVPFVSLDFKGDTTFERLSDAISDATHKLREYAEILRDISNHPWSWASTGATAGLMGMMPFGTPLAALILKLRGATSGQSASARVSEEDDWLKDIADPKVAKWIAENSTENGDRRWIRENISWLKQLRIQSGGPAAEEGAMPNTGNVDAYYLQYDKPDDADTAHKIEQMRQGVETAQQQAKLAGTVNQYDRENLQLKIAIGNADEKLLKSRAEAEKMEGSAKQKTELLALAQKQSDADKLAAQNAYSVAMDRISRQANEQVRSAQAQLEITRMQIGAAGKLDELVRARVNHNVALANIENERLSTRAGIDPGNPNKGRLESLADQTAAAKRTAENVAYEESIAETTRQQEEQTRAMKFSADQAERNLSLAHATFDVEKAKTAEILTQGDAARLAITQRIAAETEYENKRLEIEENTRKAIAEQQALIKSSERRIELHVALPEDTQAIQRATDRIKEITRKGTAEIETERVNRDTKIMQVYAEMQKTMRTSRQQTEEARAAQVAGDEAERGLEIARATLDVERARSAEIMTQANASRMASAERLVAEQEFESKRIAIAEEANKQIAEQRSIIDTATQRINGNFDGIAATPADYQALDRAIARIREIQRKANADTLKERLQLNANTTNIDINEQRNRQEALNTLRGDSYAIELAEKIIHERAKGTIEGAEAARSAAHLLRIYLDTLDLIEDHWKNVAQSMADSVTSAFETMLRGGKLADVAKAIGEVWQKNALGDISEWLKNWAGKVANAANGRDANGNVIPDGSPGAKGSPEQKRAMVKLGAAQSVGAGLAGYAAGQGGGAATASAVAAFASGLMSGNIYVAIAAAIASLIGSAIAGEQKRANYKYGVPTFLGNGQVDVQGTRNIEKPERDAMISKFQSQFNDQWNAWVNIALKLPGTKIPKLDTAFTPYSRDYFQPEASQNFLKHWDEYLANTLPDEIAGKFKDGLRASFIDAMATMARGPVTADVKKLLGAQFDKFWAEADKLDANKRTQFWSDLADGLNAFANAQRRLKNVGLAMGNLSAARFDENGNFKQNGDSDFVSTLKQGTQGIFDQARAMVNLTGPDRVAAFKQLGQSIEQVTKSLSDYIAHIGEVLRNLRNSFDDAYYQHKLFMAGEVQDANGNVIHPADKNAQARIMEEEYNRTVNKIQNAASLGLSADEVEALTNKAMGLLNDIFMLDPTAKADAWWADQMAVLDRLSQQSILELGERAKSAVDKLLLEVQPFVDWFNGLPVDLKAAQAELTGPGGAFDGFAQALEDLTKRINETLPGGGTTPSGPGTGGNGPGDGGTGGEKNQDLRTGSSFSASSAAVVTSAGDTYNFYFGNVYGVDDLQGQILAAIEYAANSKPQILQRKW